MPPLTVKVPLTSSAPLPSFVGPLTTTVPPVMVASPLESSPSPPASIVVVPPLTVTLTPAMPDVAAAVRHRPPPPPPEPSDPLMPSSLLVMASDPPAMVMTLASRPSPDFGHGRRAASDGRADVTVDAVARGRDGQRAATDHGVGCRGDAVVAAVAFTVPPSTATYPRSASSALSDFRASPPVPVAVTVPPSMRT